MQLLAAMCLPPADVDWHELALLSRGQGDMRQALYCYDRALRVAPSTVRPWLFNLLFY